MKKPDIPNSLFLAGVFLEEASRRATAGEWGACSRGMVEAYARLTEVATALQIDLVTEAKRLHAEAKPHAL